MKTKIHRGTHEIGGTCIEITANNGKTLLVDFGSPLNKENPDIEYAKNIKADAVLISHPHQDHYGLIDIINSETQIYIGEISINLINTVKDFLGKKRFVKNINTISAWKEFTIENTFKIKPYLVDHSSPEAFAFLIEVDGKRIFYSGDFRATGRKQVVFDNLINNPPKDIDLLFIEGTMIKRDNQKYKTEYEIESVFYEIFKTQTNVSFVLSSAQNIDRFVSVFKACLKLNKTVIIDVYTAKILDIVSQKSSGLPTIDWKNIKVFTKGSHIEKVKSDIDFVNRIKKREIGNEVFANPKNYVYFLRMPNEKFVEHIKKLGGKINIIYSQWGGYLETENKMYFTDYINKLKNSSDINYHHIHTSGHATIDKLILLAEKLQAKKIVPVHTEEPEMLKKVFGEAKLNNIEVWEDNVEYEII